MVARRDLNAPPGRQLADIVSGLRAEQAQSKTGAAGVTDYGETGDVRWTRPEAPEFTVSIRDIDGDLQDARGRIDEAKADSAEALVRVGEAEATVEAVQGGLDALETVTLPGAVAELEAADVAVQQAVAGLEGEVSAVQGVANAAQDAATQAASDAAAAAQDAADAAGLAASKGDVLIQSAAPAAEMRKASTLWIDTTGGANTPKRWDGSTWIAVTDKATVDAANLAAQAKAAADDAQTAADDAQTTATNAATAAGAAQSTATEALTSANGKSKITRSTSNPPAQYGGRVDDLWWVLSSLGSGGRVLSQWRWNSNVWVSEQVGGEVIANLDAAKITSGFVDAARIQAGSIYADKIVSGLSQNMVPDPGFVNAELNEARLSRGFAYNDAWTISDGVLSSTPVPGTVRTNNSNIAFSATSDLWAWPAYPGMSVRARVSARVTSGTGQFRLTIRWVNRDGTRGFTSISGWHILSGAWKDCTGEYSLPQEATGFSIQVQIFGAESTGRLDFRAPFAAASVGSTIIEDGAITTGKLLAGAVTAEKITVTEALSANIVDAMSVNTKKLVVTEEAILNHATLIGDTVVDNINVTGKLIGTDGVFTGTVDFENVNVTNELLASKVSGEYLYGTVIEGGEIRTSDALPGQVALADDGYVDTGTGTAHPGIRIEPLDPTGYVSLPGIGPNERGLIISGGRQSDGSRGHIASTPTSSLMRTYGVDGGYGVVQANPTSSLMRTVGEDGWEGLVQTSPTSSLMRTYGPGGGEGRVQASPTDSRIQTFGSNGDYGWVRAQPGDAEVAYVAPEGTYFSRVRADADEAHLYTRAGGVTRYLTVDANGTWVKTYKGGEWKQVNLEGATWNTLSLGSGWKAYTGGGGYYAGLRAQRTPLGIRLDGMIQGGSTGQIASLPASMQDVAAKQFPVAMQGGQIGIMAIHQRSGDGWWMLSYVSGPSTPGWISVSVDAALA